jgi:branched-chain amino acid transport system permease protein
MSPRIRALAVNAVILGVLFAVPWYSTRYAVSLFTLVTITGLLAVSVNMLAGEVGLVSMGHAGISGGAAYAVAWATRDGHGLVSQLLLALLLTLVVSAIYALTAMRTNGLVFLMITLALGMVVFGLAFKWSRITGGQSGLTGVRRPDALFDPYTYYYFTFAVLVVVLLLLAVLARSPLGLAMRGVRDGEQRMSSLGYNVAGTKFVAMMISGAVAGVAGVLAVWNTQFMSPSALSFNASAMAVIIIILGGVGSPLGPLVGAGLVIAIEHWLSSYVERWPTVLGLLFIAVVIWLPRGVVGAVCGTGGPLGHLVRRRPAPTATEPEASAEPAAPAATGHRTTSSPNRPPADTGRIIR